jgi:hypothetical protein
LHDLLQPSRNYFKGFSLVIATEVSHPSPPLVPISPNNEDSHVTSAALAP